MLVCPACDSPGLKITHRLKLKADMHWDERILQTLRCPHCDACFWGEHNEERRGARESSEHKATAVSPLLFDELSDALSQEDAAHARDLCTKEPGESVFLKYRAADGSPPLSRYTETRFPYPGDTLPTRARRSWLERLGDWLKN